MTFDATERGALGRPVELYEFAQGGVFFRYTNAANDQLVGATVYSSLEALRRTEPVQGNEGNAGEIQVTMPSSVPIAAQFRSVLASTLPSLTIFRVHLNDSASQLITWFKGTVVSAFYREGLATLVCQPPTRIFERPIPRAVYSGMCNHQLYDTSCKILKNNHAFIAATATVVSVSKTEIIINGLRNQAVTVNAAAGGSLIGIELDKYFLRGYIETTALPNELRMIAEANVGGDADKIRVHVPFKDLESGDEVNVYAGCPHSIDLCGRKFLNQLNFGGFPQVPADNPFNIDLETGRIDQTESRKSGPRGGFF